MNTGFLYQAILLIVSLMLVAAPALGQTVQKPLGDKENPLLIGKRDLNTDRTISIHSTKRSPSVANSPLKPTGR